MSVAGPDEDRVAREMHGLLLNWGKWAGGRIGVESTRRGEDEWSVEVIVDQAERVEAGLCELKVRRSALYDLAFQRYIRRWMTITIAREVGCSEATVRNHLGKLHAWLHGYLSAAEQADAPSNLTPLPTASGSRYVIR